MTDTNCRGWRLQFMRVPLRCARACGARKRFSYYLFAALKRRSSTFALRYAARVPSSTPSRCSVAQGRLHPTVPRASTRQGRLPPYRAKNEHGREPGSAARGRICFCSLSQHLPLQRARRASGRTRLTCRRASGAWIMGANPCYTSAP
jgi:hypothetical protein